MSDRDRPDPSRSTQPGLHFEGVIDERFQFERWPGYELPRYEPTPEGDGTVELELLDSGGQIVARTSPVIDFTEFRCQDRSPRHALVEANVPFPAEARVVQLKARGRVIFREPIPEDPPRIEGIRVAPFEGDRIPPARFGRFGSGLEIEARTDPSRDEAQLVMADWRAAPGSRADVTADILLRRPDGEEGLVARGLEAGPYVFDLAGVVHREVEVVVRVTDSVRSTSSSQRVPVRPVSPRVQVMSPVTGTVLEADTPFDLRVHLTGAGGERDPEKSLAWFIDGEEVGRGRLVPAPGLSPGTHRVEVRFAPGGRVMARAHVDIEVEERTESQKRWRRRVERLDATR